MISTRAIAFVTLLAVVGGCTSTSAPGAPAGAQGKADCIIPEYEQALVEEVIELVNQARVAEGVDPLESSVTLGAVAETYACEMVEEAFFAHENPQTGMGPGERLTTAGYLYYAMGENLAAGQTTAEEVLADWMASPRHRANILSPDWQQVGVAVRNGGAHGWYWVQEFADPVTFGEE